MKKYLEQIRIKTTFSILIEFFIGFSIFLVPFLSFMKPSNVKQLATYDPKKKGKQATNEWKETCDIHCYIFLCQIHKKWEPQAVWGTWRNPVKVENR